MAELQAISKQLTRQHNIDSVSLQIKRIETELVSLRQQQQTEEKPNPSAAPKPVQSGEQKRYECEITNYAWDQSDKFVKFFISLQGIQDAGEDNVLVEFKKNSVLLRVINLQNRDHIFTVNNLLHEIELEGSYRKVKPNSVVIYARKSLESKLDLVCSIKKFFSLHSFHISEQRWSHLTSTEKRLADSKSSTLKEDDATVSDDPSAGLMKVMQKMYESGDPEMKKMIAKAWTEGQDKQMKLPQF